MKPSRLPAWLRRALMVAACATTGTTPALAATWYWDADPLTADPQQASGTWTNGGNTWWIGGANVPWDNAADPANIAHFGTSTGVGPAEDSRTVTIDGNVNAAGVSFNTSTSGFGYILTGGSLSLGSGGFIEAAGGPATDLNRRHQLDTVITGNNITLRRLVVQDITGLAMLQLRGANTWTGNLTLTSAEGAGLFVEAYSGAALNNLTTVTVGSNAGMVLATADAFTTNFSLNGTGSSSRGALRFDVNGGSVSGNITLAGSTSIGTLNNTVTATISGNILQPTSTARALTINGGSGNTGTLILTGANNYTGRTTIANGIASVSSINSVAGGTATSNLGAPTTAANGIIYLGGSTNTGQLLYTGAGETTDRGLNLAGTTGGGTINNSGSGLLKFTGNVTATGAGIKTLNLQGAGDGEISGVISDNSAANTTGVTKASSGTWTLSGANTYSGRTTIANGTLSVSSINSVAGGTASSSLGAPITVDNGTIYLGSSGSTGQLLYTGTGETTDRVINLSGTTGGGIITQNGTGLLKFSSNLTTTGNGSKSLTLQGSGEGEFAGIISNSTSATSLIKSGTGTWTLSGANTYTGSTTVNDGILRLAGVGVINSGTLTMNGGQFDLNGTSQTITNLTGTGGAVTNGAAATSSTLNVTAASGNYGGTLADGAGSLSFTKGGSGTLTLSGANSHSGLTTVSAGVLVVGHNTALGTTAGGTTVSDGARVTLADGVVVTGEAITITGQGGANGALQASANSTGTWNGSVTTTGPEARIGAQIGGHLIINGNIDASARSVIIRTNGDASTSGADFDNTAVTFGGTYTGSDIFFYQGVLKLGASDRISDTTLITMGTSSTNIRQRFDLNGFNDTIAGLAVSGSAAGSTHEVTNSSATLSTLTLDSGTNRSFSGIVTGNLAVRKMGSNTVTFSGANTYTGTTSVDAGSFNVSGQVTGGGSVVVATSATFNLTSTGTFVFKIGDNGVNNTISGAGTTNLNGIVHFDLTTAALAEGNSWDVVDTSGSTSWTGVRITSTSGDFQDNGGIWTLDTGGSLWSFDQGTGVLSYVPEPGSAMLILTGLAGYALRRRRVA
ncbi:autotransporter-associated beta strand repeat-containing protein [Luteolibacter sp. SL250]|uniref:beta strand repeat-containing protein n=1 Tax=Luteolibacter sp. SL250 TaxID=2995170 RepID=UPI00226FFA59|nr:autotransporter-associated beta strand repeat-containing protein [Luteolibacter sp. SL250]WAC19003.1 autotransporter-associated beta strand repeat-containing protein [Luteolibacter sp. SL250]